MKLTWALVYLFRIKIHRLLVKKIRFYLESSGFQCPKFWNKGQILVQRTVLPGLIHALDRNLLEEHTKRTDRYNIRGGSYRGHEAKQIVAASTSRHNTKHLWVQRGVESRWSLLGSSFSRMPGKKSVFVVIFRLGPVSAQRLGNDIFYKHLIFWGFFYFSSSKVY